MKLNGINLLNSNWYNYIMIRNINEHNIKVKVKSKNKVKTIKENNSFYNKIKKLDNKNQINEIIKYYLRNNKIKYINEKEKLDYYDGFFISLRGSRDLFLQLKNGIIYRETIDEIINKYQKDRLDYIYNNEFKNIEIYLSSKEMYYQAYNDSRKFDEVGEEVLRIVLKTKNDKMLPFEEKFYKEFIEYLLKDCKYCYTKMVDYSNVFYKSYEGCEFYELPGCYLITDKYYIRIDKKLYNTLVDYIYYKNKEENNIKKLQLSLDIE